MMNKSKRLVTIAFSLVWAIVGLIASIPGIIVDAQGQTLPTPVAPPIVPVPVKITLAPLGNDQDDSANIQRRMVSNTDITLAGEFIVGHLIDLEGQNISIHGGRLIRQMNAADYQDGYFVSYSGVANLKLHGIVFDGTYAAPPLILHSNAPCTGADIGGCTFIKTLGFLANLPGDTVHDCLFEQSADQIGGGETYNDVTFHGYPPAGCNECLVSGSNIAMNLIRFVDTQRGPIIRGVTSLTVTDMKFIDVDSSLDNAGELFSVEGGLTNATITGLYATGCAGAIIEDWQSNLTNVTFTHVKQDGGEGIMFAGNDSGDVLNDVQLTHSGGISFGSQAQNGITFNGLAIIAPLPGQYNEHRYSAADYAPPAGSTTRPAIQNAGSNVFNGVSAMGLPAGWILGVNGQ